MQSSRSTTSDPVISEARYIQCDAVFVVRGTISFNEHVASQMQTRAPLLALRFGITRVLDDWTARFICFIIRKVGFL